MTVICVPETTTTVPQALPPIETVAPLLKKLPVIVTKAPPMLLVSAALYSILAKANPPLA